jgi:hypothetical protein
MRRFFAAFAKKYDLGLQRNRSGLGPGGAKTLGLGQPPSRILLIKQDCMCAAGLLGLVESKRGLKKTY